MSETAVVVQYEVADSAGLNDESPLHRMSHRDTHSAAPI